jgi:hypothetical protein
VTPLLALFQPRIDGDEALLRLATLRFEQAGLAAEVYARSAAELDWILGLAPASTHPPMVHLPRDLDLLDPQAEARVIRLARRFGDRVSGFVVHDRQHLPHRLPELTATAERLSSVLTRAGKARLFVEYAVGLRPEQFAEIGEALRCVERVCVCVDTGHVGIRQARREYARRCPEDDRDVAALDAADPDLPSLVDDVQAAVASGLEKVDELISALASQAKPVHFHLHDGHPLVPGLSDHYGFLLRVPVPFTYQGMRSLSPLYGPAGLGRILHVATETLGEDRSSFTLEIHEHTGRLPLIPGEAEGLFPHWRDLANAERMNFWLRELAENASLVRGLAAPAPAHAPAPVPAW